MCITFKTLNFIGGWLFALAFLLSYSAIALAIEDPLPPGPLPIGLPDLPEVRTIKELRPGLIHVHIERGIPWSVKGPGKLCLSSGGKESREELAPIRACLEAAGYTVYEHRITTPSGVTPYYVLTAGEFDNLEEARIAENRLSCAGVRSNNMARLMNWETGPWSIEIVVIDPRVYKGKVTSAWSERAWRESPLELARRHNAVVATNGSFFEYSSGEIGGIPAGISIVQGEWHHEAQPRSHNAPMLFIDNAPDLGTSFTIEYDAPPFPELKWEGRDGKQHSVKLDGIDRMPSVAKLLHGGLPSNPDELIAMRSEVWDSSPLSHAIPDHILTRQVLRDGTLARGSGFEQGIMLLATGAKQEILKEAIDSGKPVELDLRVAGRPALNAWYVKPVLIKDGVPANVPRHGGRVARTMIGADAVGRIYLMVIDETPPRGLPDDEGVIGFGIHEQLDLAKFLGLVNAANLDGGSRSTSMVIEGKVMGPSAKHHITSPYDDDRRVGDAIIVTDD